MGLVNQNLAVSCIIFTGYIVCGNIISSHKIPTQLEGGGGGWVAIRCCYKYQASLNVWFEAFGVSTSIFCQ